MRNSKAPLHQIQQKKGKGAKHEVVYQGRAWPFIFNQGNRRELSYKCNIFVNMKQVGS